MSQYSSRGVGYSASAPSETRLLIREKLTPTNGTSPGILCFPGHGADSSQYQPFASSATFGPGYHAWQLAEAGYIVTAIDAGAGGTSWGNSVAMSRATDGYNWLTGVGGAKSGKIGVMGWSMGGLTALNWVKRNPSLVAGVVIWAPVTDLDWAHSTAGYTPAYGGSAAGNATWTTEIDSAYNPYATSSNGYRVRDEYDSWNSLGVSIKVIHASDDATVPLAQSQNGFVASVNSPAVTLRTPIPTGGHSGVFGNVPGAETTAFFNGLNWS